MKSLWEKWKVIAEKIGNFQTIVIFSFLYFILVSPIGFLVSHFRDFLNSHKFPTWQQYKQNMSNINDSASQ